MARPATGSARWLERQQLWVARITSPSGKREPTPLRGIPACLVNPTAPKAKCTCAPCTQARRIAKKLSDDARGNAEVSASTGETSNEWHARYIARHKELGKATSGMAGAWRTWLGNTIGTLPMSEVTRAHVVKIRNALAKAVEDDAITSKRAMNVWSDVIRAPFSRAFTDDDPRYSIVRVGPASANPTSGVKPPVTKEQLDEDRRERQPIYPHEFNQVVECTAIPIAARRLYAIATYLYVRPQELYALRWADVDWAAREVRIRRKLNPRNSKELPGTKSDAGVREVPIHPHLMPLLKAMHEEAGRNDEARIVLPPKGVRKLTDKLAADTREALALAKVARTELVDGTPDLMPFDFRSWRTTGCTWLAMLGTDSYVIALQAGHKSPDTTWGSYIKRGPDLRQRYGEPFPVLPAALLGGGSGFGSDSGSGQNRPSNSGDLGSGTRDSKPSLDGRHLPRRRAGRSPPSVDKTGTKSPSKVVPATVSALAYADRNVLAEPKQVDPLVKPPGSADAELARLVASLLADGQRGRAMAVIAAYAEDAHHVDRAAYAAETERGSDE